MTPDGRRKKWGNEPAVLTKQFFDPIAMGMVKAVGILPTPLTPNIRMISSANSPRLGARDFVVGPADPSTDNPGSTQPLFVETRSDQTVPRTVLADVAFESSLVEFRPPVATLNVERASFRPFSFSPESEP